MPFPTTQGTQAIVAAILRALPDATLLTYAGGQGDSDVELIRLADFPRVASLRSGPSLGKIALDVRMIGELRRQVRTLKPDWVIAHNVEAACVAWAARIERWAYFAHTRFDTELPSYSRLPGLGVLGRALDGLAGRAPKVLAITPTLAEHLGGVHVMPPWPVGHVPSAAERAEARFEGPTLLYAGNLDAYQGLDVLFEATRGYRLIVATESADALPERVIRWRLRDEADRRRAHAVADLVVVPRRSPGGLPIKMLDAMAREVPVVAQERALAGLRPEGVRPVKDDDPGALRRGIELALAAPPRGGRAWIAEHASEAEFTSRFHSLLRCSAARRSSRSS